MAKNQKHEKGRSGWAEVPIPTRCAAGAVSEKQTGTYHFICLLLEWTYHQCDLLNESFQC